MLEANRRKPYAMIPGCDRPEPALGDFQADASRRSGPGTVCQTGPTPQNQEHEVTCHRASLSKSLCLAACVAGLTVFSGCTSVTLPAAPAVAQSADYSYVIGAGDNLNIVVWRNPELSLSVPVRPDGKVSAPLVDELVAQGKTPPELARDIEKRLATYVRDPVVTVIVTGFVGPYSEQIRVVGEAARPLFLPYKQKMTLLDVMIAVGGLTDFADGNRAIIQRTSDGNKQYAVRLKDLIKRGDTSANVEMRPGDILIIPQSLF
jgi:polysaccharide export outer membrane protein